MTFYPHVFLSELESFKYDLVRYRHSKNPCILYTPGIKHLADNANAHWLIDTIVSYHDSPTMKRAIKKDDRMALFQLWYLHVNVDQSAVLTMKADFDCDTVITHKVSFTDFPLSLIHIMFRQEEGNYTLRLITEHAY